MRGTDVAPGVSGASSPYTQLVSVFRGMNIIASSLSRVPIELWRGDEQVIAGPAVELLRRPNNAMRWRKFIETIVVGYHSGDAFIRLGPRTSLGLPTVLELLAYESVKPIRENEQNPYSLKGWEVKVGYEPKPVPIEDIVRIEYAPSGDPFRGMSCFTPARISLDTEVMAGHYQRTTLKRGGTPGSLLTKKGGKGLTDKDKRLAEIEWSAKFGPASNAGGVAILNDEWDYRILGMSPKDMEFLQLRNWSLSEVGRMLNLPTLYLWLFEGASGLGDARWKAEERALYYLNIIPLASKITEEFNELIFRPHDPSLECIFNFDNVEALRDDLTAKAGVMSQLIAAGATFEQVNERLDMGFDCEGKPWQFEHIVSLGQTTATAVVEQARLDVESMGEEDELAPTPPMPGPTPEEEQAQEDAADEIEVVEGHDDRDEALDAEAASLDATLREPEGLTPELRAAMSKAKRSVVHRDFLRRMVKNEGAIDRKVRNVMTRQRKLVEKALMAASGVSKRAYLRAMQGVETRGMDDPFTLTPQQIQAILSQIVSGTTVSAISPNLEEAYRAGSMSLDQMLAAVGVPRENLYKFQEERVPKLVANYVDRRLKAEPSLIDDNTRKLVNKRLLNVLTEGGTLRDGIQGVRDVFNASLTRARTIARTESTIAGNAARFEAMQEQLVYEHEWVAILDDHTRPDHEELDGEVRAVGDEFLPGLKFPGDPDAPPEQVINCRCTTAPLSARAREAGESEAASMRRTPKLGVMHRPVTHTRIIKKTAKGFVVLAENGKKLGGPYDTREEADKRLAQVEMFKHKKSVREGSR